MSRYERRIHFERLVELRRAYATLGEDDRVAAMTIGQAIAWAECQLDATCVTDERPTTEIDSSGTTR